MAGSAAAPQGFFGLQGHPNGAVTPLDEPRVAAAKADHLATKFGAYGAAAVNYAGAGAGSPLGYAGAYGAAPYAALPVHIPTLVAHPNGAVTPADEPAVVAARAQHLAAKE